MKFCTQGKAVIRPLPGQLLLFMKVTAFLLLVVSLHVSAKSFAQRISIDEENVFPARIFSILQSKYGLAVIYDNKLLPPDKRVSVHMRDASVEDVLQVVLEDLPLSYVIEDKIIFISPRKVATTEKGPVTAVQVSGVIRNENGVVLQGASILLKSKSFQKNIVTGEDGKFTLSGIPSGLYILTVTSVGYNRYERAVQVNDKDVLLDVILNAAIKHLDEAVVIGYGTQRSGNITGSIASVSAEQIKQSPGAGLDKALQGRVAGVQVTQTSGQPGGSVSVRIRGVSSVSAGNEPLYVIDGVPFYNWSTTFNMGPSGIYGTGVLQNAMSAINPNDITSIQVLKDAAATAIYGSRAANGVVIVTTKRGKPGKSLIELDAYYGVQHVGKKLDVLNSREYATLINESRVNGWRDLGSPSSLPATVKPIPDLADPAALKTNTNWQDQVFKHAATQNYQLTVSGGTDKTLFTFSGNYYNQDGIILQSGYKRYAGRLNLEQTVTDKLKMGGNVSISNATNIINRATGLETQGGIIFGALFQTPHIPVYDSVGDYARPKYSNGFALIDNPVASARLYFHTINTTRAITSMYGDLKLGKHLSFRSSIGFDAMYLKNNIYIPTNSGTPPPTTGAGFAFASQEVAWINENILTWHRLLGKHDVTVTAGTTIQSSHFERMISRVFNFPNDLVITTNGGQTDLTNSFAEDWRMISYLARALYSYDDRFLLSLAARIDGSSRFGPGKRYGKFPSISAGWRISRESFMQDMAWLYELKVRASYGLTGNSEIINTTSSFANYPYIGKIDPANYSFGGKPVNGLAPGSISNDDLKWESTAQFNAGLDLALWGGRVSVTADYYIKTTRDMLVGSAPLLFTTGFSSSIQNIGSMENKGYELAIQTVNLTGPLKWTTDLTLSRNWNKLLSLGADGRKIFNGPNSLTEAGSPVGSFYGYVTDGIFQTQADIDKAAAQPGARPGDIRFKDLNNDKVIDANDQRILGNPQPDHIFSMNNQLSYKNFDLSIFLQGVKGNEIANLTRQKMEMLMGYYNGSKNTLNRWKSAAEPGNGNMPRATAIDPNNNRRFSDRWVEDGSFLRCKTISLGYTFTQPWFRKLKVYISAQNPFTLTSYSGYDPEMSRTSSDGDNPLHAGFDEGNYPVAKSWLIGLNVQF